MDIKSNDSFTGLGYPQHFHQLAHLKGSTFSLSRLGSAVTADADLRRFAAAILIVNTVYSLTVNLQPGFRCFEQVLERTILILVKASAACLMSLLRTASVHNDSLLAAAVIRVVKTAFYTTLQICHDNSSYTSFSS